MFMKPPPIAISGLLVTSSPAWLPLVQLAVLGPDAMTPNEPELPMPVMPLMAEAADSPAGAG